MIRKIEGKSEKYFRVSSVKQTSIHSPILAFWSTRYDVNENSLPPIIENVKYIPSASVINSYARTFSTVDEVSIGLVSAIYFN